MSVNSRPTPPKIPRPCPAPRTSSPLLTSYLEQYRQGGVTHNQLIQALEGLTAQGTPIVESLPADGQEQIVTFLYHHPQAQRVLIFINRLTDERNVDDSLMERVAHTPFFSISYRMRKDWRASYSFIVQELGQPAPWEGTKDQRQLRQALDWGLADPHNSLRCLNSRGHELSVVELDSAPEQLFLSAAHPLQVRWSLTPSGREYWAMSLGDVEDTSPILLILDGEKWVALGLVGMLRAALRAEYLPPCFLVFIHSGGREQRWQELSGAFSYTDYLADELLPQVQLDFGISASGIKLILGQSLGGLTALLSVVRRPETFAGAFAQSASLWQEEILKELDACQGGALAWAGSRVMLEVGEQEWVLWPAHETFVQRAQERGLKVIYRTYNGGHDYACWRGSLIPSVRTLLSECARSGFSAEEKG